MTTKSKRRVGGLVVLLTMMAAIACSPQPEQVELIPRDVLFGNPEKSTARLSPDGTRMSYLAPHNGVLNVWVGEIGSDSMKVVTNDTLRGIRSYFWAYDNEHILYLQDQGGDENWRIYAVNLKTNETRDLTPFDNVQARIIDVDKNYPNRLLIGLNKDNPRLHDVYSLNIATGDMKMVAKNSGAVVGWLVDPKFKVRGALMANAGAGFDLMVRESEQADWRLLLSFDSQNSLTSGPVSFTGDGMGMYLLDSRDANAARLVQVDIATGKTEVIAADPNYDISDVMIHPDTYEVQAVTFTKARDSIYVLDESVADDINAIKALHRGDMMLVSRDDADDTWLVAFTTDNGPVPYYSFDRKSRKGTFLFYTRPELNNYVLANMEPFSFQARDGLTIHGYLSFPPGQPREHLPTVLNVHGGPWYRDAWGYHPEAQWMANRGYLCMQINFRGSTGYGKEFVNAGDREWGGKMHNDLIDGVNWAIDKGFADPDRIAIYGGSYGGYAALVGASFTPDVFACAVSAVGPSNLLTFINSIPPYWETMREMLQQRIGDPVEDSAFLVDRSPLFRADQIRIPMLIAQGANDPRVKKAESDQIIEALEENGVPHEYLVFPDEGHGFARPENRLKYYMAVEQFLAKHLGGRAEAKQ